MMFLMPAAMCEYSQDIQSCHSVSSLTCDSIAENSIQKSLALFLNKEERSFFGGPAYSLPLGISFLMLGLLAALQVFSRIKTGAILLFLAVQLHGIKKVLYSC